MSILAILMLLVAIPVPATATSIITTVAGTGLPGSSGDGGPATSATLNNSVGVAPDSHGNCFIAEQFGHRIRRVDVLTGIITTVASLGLRNPSGVALDEDNGVLRLLVADGHPPR